MSICRIELDFGIELSAVTRDRTALNCPIRYLTAGVARTRTRVAVSPVFILVALFVPADTLLTTTCTPNPPHAHAKWIAWNMREARTHRRIEARSREHWPRMAWRWLYDKIFRPYMNYFRSVGDHDCAWGIAACVCMLAPSVHGTACECMILLWPCAMQYPKSVSWIHAKSSVGGKCDGVRARTASVKCPRVYRDGVFLRCFSTPLACVDSTKCSRC